MEFEQYCIHQLLDDVLAITRELIILKSIVVKKNYALPDCQVLVNKPKIKIALTNIIINAIEAMPSEKGELKLIARSMNGKCVLEIEDNGAGISEENLKHIFPPYFPNKPGGRGPRLSKTLSF